MINPPICTIIGRKILYSPPNKNLTLNGINIIFGNGFYPISVKHNISFLLNRTPGEIRTRIFSSELRLFGSKPNPTTGALILCIIYLVSNQVDVLFLMPFDALSNKIYFYFSLIHVQ